MIFEALSFLTQSAIIYPNPARRINFPTRKREHSSEEYLFIIIKEMATDASTNHAEAAVEKKAPKKVKLPTLKDLLEAGSHFGHETQRWNPKMKKFIYKAQNGIHIIDAEQTIDSLKKASEFLVEAASRGPVLFVGTKKQAQEIIKSNAIKSGSFFIDKRWAGGLLTNFEEVKRSLNKLKALEQAFTEGVEGRTKYEISRMKKEWQRLDRLYAGVKLLAAKPTAVIVVDVKYDKGAIREAKKLGIPVVALVDTNNDPDKADYVIPSNDDAVKTLELIVGCLADAVLAGNEGNGIKHDLKDYVKAEVKIAKVEEPVEEEKAKAIVEAESKAFVSEPKVQTTAPKKSAAKSKAVKGILERVQEETEKKRKATKKTTKK